MALVTKMLATLLLSSFWAVTYGQNACLTDGTACTSGRTYLYLFRCGISDDDIADLKACFATVGRRVITWVNLGENELSTLPSDLFEDMGVLETLDLGENSIASVDGVNFPSSVTTLDLSKNQITSIDGAAFPSSLLTLYLSTNAITSIDGATFPASLDTLSLTDNLITSVDEVDFPPLEYLYLNNNPITSVDEVAFPSSLEYLGLPGTDLGTIAANAFSNLGSLKWLYLEGSSIVAIETGAFEDLISLERLHLGENLLEFLPSNLFASLGELENLYLSDNRLAKMPEDAFAGLSSAREIWLDNNDLTSLPDGIFKDLGGGEGGSLWLLNLEDNPDLQCVPEVYLVGVGYDGTGYISDYYLVDLPITPGLCECTPVASITCAEGDTCTPGAEGFICDEDEVGSTTCSNGFPGIQASNDNGEVCCSAGCSQCGGAGCGSSGAAEGLDNTDCCINGILNNRPLCSAQLSSPCIMDNKGAGSCESLSVFGIAGTNENGSVCCPSDCEQCGGAGCGSVPSGLPNEFCCINGVLRTQPLCSEIGETPCII